MPTAITSSGRFPVLRSDLADQANIEETLETFYLGATLGASGIEKYLVQFDDRITDVESTIAGADLNVFNDGEFKIQRSGDTGNKISFSLASVTGDRVVTVPAGGNFTIVGTALSQTLTNKTISGSSNTVSVSDTNFTLANGSGTLRFDLAYMNSGLTMIKIPRVGDQAYSSLASTMVLTDIDQILTKKTFGGYKESVLVSTNTTAIDADVYNVAKVTVNADTTISFTNLPSSNAYSCTIVFVNGITPRTITWPAGMKWPAGTAWTALGASETQVIVVTYIAGTYFAVDTGGDFA